MTSSRRAFLLFVLMAVVDFKLGREFVCVEYPGIVKNAEKMLETMGGISTISKTLAEPSRRLELRFRPENVYCKPVCGDRSETSNLLLRIVRRRSVEEAGSSIESQQWSYHVQVLGVVTTTFKFQGLVDYQYLPMVKQEGGSYRSLEEQIVPRGLAPLSFIKADAPLFLPPPIFSRMDVPTNYHFRKDPQPRAGTAEAKQVIPGNVMTKIRQRRIGYAIYVSFSNGEPIPMHPKALVDEQLKLKFCDSKFIEIVKKLFEERPIWSRNALLPKAQCTRVKLKYILPAVAYYFTDGPWRSLWVKFGYDPSKDPKAKLYQLLDFRVKTDKHTIAPKRSAWCYTLPTKLMTPLPKASVLQRGPSDKDGGSSSDKNTNSMYQDSIHTYRPGMIPPFRQMFYQLCDIEIDHIQQLIHCSNEQGTFSKKEGWLTHEIISKCRDILAEHVTQAMAAQAEAAKDAPSTSGLQDSGLDRSEEKEGEMFSEVWEPTDDESDVEMDLT